MLRRAPHFFSSTSLRQYATNSSKHLRLQAELSKTLAQYRDSNEQISYLAELKHILTNYSEDGKKTAHPLRENAKLNKVEKIEEKHILQKEFPMKKAKNLLAKIRIECADTQAPRSTHLKPSK